jgi:hypothetical protein
MTPAEASATVGPNSRRASSQVSGDGAGADERLGEHDHARVLAEDREPRPHPGRVQGGLEDRRVRDPVRRRGPEPVPVGGELALERVLDLVAVERRAAVQGDVGDAHDQRNADDGAEQQALAARHRRPAGAHRGAWASIARATSSPSRTA